MKPKFSLRIKDLGSEEAGSSTSTQSTPKKKYTRHLSMHHEKEIQKKREAKKKEIEQAVIYCRENSCKGYKAITDLNLKFCKDPRTINARLEKEVVAGEEQRILTVTEERTLVRYLINRNRACQGLHEEQVSGVVLNMLRVRRERNKRLKSKQDGGWGKKVPLSVNAKSALHCGKVGRSFFRRFRAEHPEVKPKLQHKVSVKRGLRCTKEMAIDYLDSLAKLLIETGIAPELKKTDPGIWVGEIDVTRIWAHDETPQLINYNASGQSKKKIFAGTSEDCSELSKENRESVTVQPFSNFAGELAMVQVVFSGAGITNHMCPKNAAEKIPNLFISVTEKGSTTGQSLLPAYKHLFDTSISTMRQARATDEAHVIIAEGHKSRFEGNLLRFCVENKMEQFIIWPDTSGATQKHDQINSQLHSKYEDVKSAMFSSYSDINRECFMNILAECIKDWATPEKLIKAGKKVGITSTGLSVEWMDQEMFARAEAILNPTTPTKPDTVEIPSPVGVRRNSAKYWKSKFTEAMGQLTARQHLEYPLENVNGLLPFKTVKPTSTQRKKITDVHGSLSATEVMKLVEAKEQEDIKKGEKKKERLEMKEALKMKFFACKEKCCCGAGKCEAFDLQQCSVCKNVLKSKCGKKACRSEDGGPEMILVSARREKAKKKRTKKNYENLAESEDEEQQYGDDDEEFYEESHEMYEYGLEEESGINLMVPVSDDEDIDIHVDTL